MVRLTTLLSSKLAMLRAIREQNDQTGCECKSCTIHIGHEIETKAPLIMSMATVVRSTPAFGQAACLATSPRTGYAVTNDVGVRESPVSRTPCPSRSLLAFAQPGGAGRGQAGCLRGLCSVAPRAD